MVARTRCVGGPDLCDDGVSGWCPTQNPSAYLKQCLSAGGGCGNGAILADSNCDGQLNICQICPPNTHPVDTNGDGCQDACDCCDELVCENDTVPMDTDDDGCPDQCVGGPDLCKEGISGWCPSQNAAD